ncbi:MAG: cytidine deaminase [Candidatus Wallbacteria bacterium]|nr:cytidine deaminase [Candidatus Wallbacteria bacterium]
MPELDLLIKRARAAQARAHNPYSGFGVGAAVLTGNGKIFDGCNIENASYGLTVCAERVAIFKAVSEGEKSFKKLVLVSSAGDFTPPCGACRQVMAEFGDFEVIMVDKDNRTKIMKVSELLPASFSLK